MSLIQRIKLAARDHGMYMFEIDDNWGPIEKQMYYALCNKFEGEYSDFPTTNGQKPEFLEFLDRYKDSEYTHPKPEPTPVKSGVDLRQFMPDPFPIPPGADKRQISLFEDANAANSVKPFVENTPKPQFRDTSRETPRQAVAREVRETKIKTR